MPVSRVGPLQDRLSDYQRNVILSQSRRDLRTVLKRMRVTDQERCQRNQHIRDHLLQTSATIRTPDFTRLYGNDIRILFEQYDQRYFDGSLRRALDQIPLTFRVSSRMTRAGGKTSSWRRRQTDVIERFEIVVSSTLLFQTFREDAPDRTIRVTGLECHDRLDALMRVMEHEVIHLSELLGWDVSSCSQDRFQTFAWQVFGHTDHRHALMTPREHAASLGVRVGAKVRFEFQGQVLEGIVNRVTRRATVLVPDRNGERFSDGRTYRRYYVPVAMLASVSDES